MSKRSKSQLSNNVAPLGKTGYKTKMYLKKLSEANDNPRYAASKHGSVVGGLICGLAKTRKEEEVVETPAEPIEDIDQEMLDVDLEGEGIPQEEDEITFAGETESAFFNYLKRGLNSDEDANTVATTAVDAIGSVYSTKTSVLSKKYKEIHDKLTEQKQARQNLEEEVKKMKEELQNN